MPNLDTPIPIHALAGDSSARERELLSANSLSIRAIVLWELAKPVQLGCVELDLEGAEVVRVLSSLDVWPLDPPLSLASRKPLALESWL